VFSGLEYLVFVNYEIFAKDWDVGCVLFCNFEVFEASLEMFFVC